MFQRKLELIMFQMNLALISLTYVTATVFFHLFSHFLIYMSISLSVGEVHITEHLEIMNFSSSLLPLL